MSTANFPSYVQCTFRLKKGITLTEWARRKQLNVKTVHAAVHGTRKGKKSLQILARIQRELAA
jgi:hypothetical protein